jgi:hypothetical protein
MRGRIPPGSRWNGARLLLLRCDLARETITELVVDPPFSRAHVPDKRRYARRVGSHAPAGGAPL